MSSTLTRGLILKYPIDPTAVNPNNKIVGEVHDLGVGINRAIVPNYSAFYSESLVVRVEDRVDPLVPNEHYIAAQLHADATASLNREVCMAVVIKDQNVMGKITLEYQTVGGDFSISVDALRRAIEDEDLDERTVSWGDIIARPSAYPPAPHLHDIGDLYGFEYVVEALEALRAAILIGDEATHEEIRQWVRYEDSLLRDRIAETNGNLNTHIQNKTNPHAVTKAQVGLGNVDNYPTATRAEAVAGTATNRFMTPATTQVMLENIVGDSVSSHASRQDNPHQVTKSQVGLGNVDNFETASQVEAMEGTSETLFMTPYTTLLVSQGAARALVKEHSDRKDNPHGVTAAQLGAVTTEDLATRLLGYMTNGSKAVDSDKLNGYTYEQIMASVSGGQAEDTLRFGGYTVPELEEYFTQQIAPRATHLEGKTLATINSEILARVTSPQTAVFAGHESEVATDRAWTRLFSTAEPRFEAIVTLHEQDDARSSTSLVKLVDADGANGAYQDADHVIICGEDTGHFFRIKAVGERKELWVESGAQSRGDIHCQVVSAVGNTDIVFSGEVFEGEPDWAEFDLETADEPVITPTKVYLIDNVMLEARLDAFAAEMRSEALESIDQAPE